MDQTDDIEQGTDGREQALAEAREAARRRDPNGMLAALFRSRVLDGLQRAFEKRWEGQVPTAGVEEAIAHAVDRAYTTLADGRAIAHLSTWLWKATENAIKDQWSTYHKHRVDASVLETDGPQEGVAAEPDGSAVSRAALRDEAMRRARALLPKLGQANVVRVMEYILTAVDAGISDLSAAEIGESLDLEASTVRVLKQRGFKRLTRLAQEAGLHLDRRTLAQLGQSLAADEEQDEEAPDNE